MAAVYSARAVVELMLESADKQDVSVDRTTVESYVRPLLPNYDAMEALRIHDFHRFGLRYEANASRMLGPVKLHVRQGGAALFFNADGLQEATSGNSRVDHQRSLTLAGDALWLAGHDQPVPICEIVEIFISAIPYALRAFDEQTTDQSTE